MTVALAALAALFFGTAGAAQHHAAHQVDRHPALHPGLVLALLRRPWWLLGAAASVVGLALQTAALGGGSIVVVQTVLVSSLAWTTVGEALFARRHPDRRIVAGTALAAAGVVGVLVLLRPRLPPATTVPTPAAVAVVLAGAAVVVGAGLLTATRRVGRARALGLATATGVCYGLTAALLKLVGTQIRDGGWPAPLHHPALYATAALGCAAVVLNQNTLQHGRPVTPALAVVVLLDPLVGVVTGVSWFAERVTADPLALAGAVACLLVAVAGVALGQAAAIGPDPAVTPSISTAGETVDERRPAA